MKLVYSDTKAEVKVGDAHTINGFRVVVIHFTEPFSKDEEDFSVQVERPVRLNKKTRWLHARTIGAEWIDE